MLLTEKTVLIVEDDLDYRNRLRDFLSAHGCNISVADDGEQAVERLWFYKPEVVVLDMLMPNLDGFGFLEKIRNNPDPAISNTPVIVLSNLASEKDIQKAAAFKIEAYFIKANSSFDQVLQKVLAVLFKGNVPPSSRITEFENLMN